MSKLVAYYDHFNDCLQRGGDLEGDAAQAEAGGNKVTRYYAESKHDAAYPRLVLALRNLIDAPTDDNGAAVRIEMRRTARLLLAELGEVKVCQHGTGRITPDGWECAACGEKFRHDPLSPANAWPNLIGDTTAFVNAVRYALMEYEGTMGQHAEMWSKLPEFLKRKTP